MTKIHPTILPEMPNRKARQIINTIHTLTNGMNRQDAVIVVLGIDGNYHHIIVRATIGEDFRDALKRTIKDL